MSNSLQPFSAALAQLRSSWIQRGWSFDNRFNCIASSFPAEHAVRARELVSAVLPHSWTSRTLASAPPVFLQIAERTGGLRSAQQLFGGPPTGRLVPYGLWWPWEEGTVISLRLGVENASMGEILEFCSIFGAEP